MADKIGPEPIVAEPGLRVFATAPAREDAAADTLAGTVLEGPTAETWDRREDRIGCAEMGRSDACDLIDDNNAPAPAAFPPTVGAREAVCPVLANNDEIADDRLGASVSDGPAAEI